MATSVVTYQPAAGQQYIDLTSWAGAAAFTATPVATDQIEGPDTLTIGVDGTVTGADGTYVLRHIQASTGTTEAVSFTVANPDVIDPVLSAQSATVTGQTTLDATVTTDEDNGTIFALASINATETSPTVFSSGTTRAVTMTGQQAVPITDLTAGTAYYVHFLHVDAAGNESLVVTSAQVTTDAASTGTSSATTTVTYAPPAGKTAVTLITGFDGYIFQHWTTQPVVGEQIVCTDAELTISNLADVTTDTEGVFDVWFVALDGTTTAITVDTTGLTAVEGVDTTPDAFSFTALTGQALSTSVEFGPITLAGVTAATDCAVSITGGTYAVSTDDGVTFGGDTSSTTQVQLGYQVKVLLDTSAENSTATSATLTINGVSATATATTLAAVIDTTPPTITLNSGSTLTLTVGDPFTDPGATATDSAGNPLAVTVTGTANLSEPNTSVLTYTATNADGYSASATLTITVAAPVPQVPQGEFVTLFPETTQTTASISYYYDGSDETGFEYSLNGVDWMTAGNPLTFSGLTASTTYTAQLLAVNAVGPGEAIAINFRTRGEVTLTPDGDWPFFTPTTAAPKTWEWGYRHPKTGVRVRVYK